MKPLSDITDEDAIELARIVTQSYSEEAQKFCDEHKPITVKGRADDNITLRF